MPEPTTIALIGATAISAVGSIAAGASESAAAEFNAEQARIDAEQERQISEQEAEDKRREGSKVLAAARARSAASGVTLQGSPLLNLEATAGEIELGAQRIKNSGERRALRFESEAELNKSRASSARTGGFLGAGTTLLTAGTKFDFETGKVVR